ncbi:hypothetical protein FZ103_22495 [Streptomonospora sp. PA3]|uniref:hypothetical protein n=1 Tax=Streptomonospora sp. PA3 TaxID=2607326 RepID=UPI0012DC989F|nr:hypothetical protein [Streptomonospora sp. PA3]MUL43897.1 hypothetical protein [Streptomonospora sp. PA3]
MSAQSEPGDVPDSPHPRQPAADDPGAIGPYTLAGRLAEDETGVLYEALDAHGAPVAVRVAGERTAADSWFRSSFTRRLAALRNVAGVCATPVLAADSDAERPWIATGFPSGPTLRSRVELHGPLPHEALFALAAGTAEALAAVEPTGLAYGTISPDDVVLAPDGPRILGLDAVGGAGGSAFAPAPRPAAATEWASPEAADGAEPAAPGDVFSWGCLVAYAATGRHPFATGGASTTAEMRRRARETGPDLDGIPTELVPLVKLALAPEPGARPTAESAYRGLVAFASTDDTSQVPTRDLADRLRAILATGWDGVGSERGGDADPAARQEAPADAPAHPGGSGGAPEGDRPAGAPATAPAGARATAVVTAASMAAVIVIGAGSFVAAASFVGEPQAAPSESPTSPFGSAKQEIARAVGALKDAPTYRAVEDLSGGGPRIPVRREYVKANLDGQRHYMAVTLMGDTEDPAPGSSDWIYRPAHGDISRDRMIYREYGGGVEGEYSLHHLSTEYADTVTDPAAVQAPLDQLHTSMRVDQRIEGNLNGTDALHVSGSFDYLPNAYLHEFGEAQEQEPVSAPFDIWTAADGRPLRFSYTVGGIEHTWEYSGFEGLDNRVCGTADVGAEARRAFLVPTRADMACSEVRPVVEEFIAIPEAELRLAGHVAEVGEWTCRMPPVVADEWSDPAYRVVLGACYRGAVGAPERVDIVRLK